MDCNFRYHFSSLKSMDLAMDIFTQPLCHELGLAQRLFLNTGWNDKIVIPKKTTLQVYFKTFIEKINSGNLIMS